MAKVKKRKKRVKIGNILLILVVFCCIGGLFYYAIKMPIKNIYISGNNIVSDNEILSLASLYDYPSFIQTKTKVLEEMILKNSYIEDVSVKKRFGNIIEIEITEYKAIAVTKDDLVILESGDALENIYDFSDVPILINEITDEGILKNFAKKFALVDDDILRQISEIEYSPVSVDEDRFLLYMSDGNMVYITLTKISKLNKYNKIKDKLGGKKGVIYLDSGDYVEIKSDDTENDSDTTDSDSNEVAED